MWPFVKSKRTSKEELEEKLATADRARDKLDAMHEQLEKAVSDMMHTPKEKLND